jgi:hypothetical protein
MSRKEEPKEESLFSYTKKLLYMSVIDHVDYFSRSVKGSLYRTGKQKMYSAAVPHADDNISSREEDPEPWTYL